MNEPIPKDSKSKSAVTYQRRERKVKYNIIKLCIAIASILMSINISFIFYATISIGPELFLNIFMLVYYIVLLSIFVCMTYTL